MFPAPRRKSYRKQFATALVVSSFWCAPQLASAQEASAENKAAARDLAVEGIKLAQDGNCNEAIPKLTRAEKLFHAPTILTWIGQCQIELGRYVEGTETLNRVVRENIEAGAPDAYKAAQDKARTLIAEAKPKIGKLTIDVTPADIEGLEVTVDERTIAAALVGAPKPTDPGTHVVTVSAPGYKSSTQEVELGEGGQESISFDLEKDPNAAAAGADTGSGSEQGPTATPEDGSSSPNWLGWGAIGVGAALMAGGGVTGYLALDKKSDLDCESDGRCASNQEDTLNSAKANATVSTILFGVGGAAVVTGVVLLVTGGSKKDSAYSNGSSHATGRYIQPTIGLGSLGLEGAF